MRDGTQPRRWRPSRSAIRVELVHRGAGGLGRTRPRRQVGSTLPIRHCVRRSGNCGPAGPGSLAAGCFGTDFGATGGVAPSAFGNRCGRCNTVTKRVWKPTGDALKMTRPSASTTAASTTCRAVLRPVQHRRRTRAESSFPLTCSVRETVRPSRRSEKACPCAIRNGDRC